jgi:hypothetical protein
VSAAISKKDLIAKTQPLPLMGVVVELKRVEIPDSAICEECLETLKMHKLMSDGLFADCFSHVFKPIKLNGNTLCPAEERNAYERVMKEARDERDS